MNQAPSPNFGICIIDPHPCCERTRQEVLHCLDAGLRVSVLSPAEDKNRPSRLPSEVLWQPLVPQVFRHPIRLKRAVDETAADAVHAHCSVALLLYLRLCFGRKFLNDFNDGILLHRVGFHKFLGAEQTTDIFEMSEHWRQALTETEVNRLDAIQAMVPPDAESILDIGCGDGRITDELAKRAGLVIGADPSAVALSMHDNLRTQASLPDLPFADRAFDLVSAFEVLEHLDDKMLRRAVSEIARLAKNHILVGVPHRETLSLRNVRCIRCKLVFNQIGHLQRFTRRRLKSLIPGFRMVGFQPCGAPSRPYYNSLLLAIRQRVGGVFHRTARTICPQCHLALSPTGTNEVTSISFACNKLNNRLRKILPLAPSHCLALYQRTAN